MATYWDPFQEMDRLFSTFAGNARQSGGMPMDLFRTGDHYVLSMDLPGVDPEAQHQRGLEYSTTLARDVLDAGAPGVHVYTFNKHRPALDLLERVGLIGRAAA